MSAVLVVLTAVTVVFVAGLVVVLLGDERLHQPAPRVPREPRTHGECWRLAEARRRRQPGRGAEPAARAAEVMSTFQAPLPAVHASPWTPLGWLPNEHPTLARRVDVGAIPLAPIAAFVDPPAVYDLFQRISPRTEAAA